MTIMSMIVQSKVYKMNSYDQTLIIVYDMFG